MLDRVFLSTKECILLVLLLVPESFFRDGIIGRQVDLQNFRLGIKRFKSCNLKTDQVLPLVQAVHWSD